MKEIYSVGLGLLVIINLVQPTYAQETNIKVASVKEPENYSTSATQLLAQSNNTKVTGVQVNTTDKGIEVILKSTNIEALQPVNKSQGNDFIVEIPNAVLSLDKATNFNKANPAPGITSISVIQANANTIKLTVTGEKGLPTAELFDDNEGLIFELVPVASATKPQQQSQKLVKIDQVQFNNTDQGLEIILATPEADKLQISSKTEGNKFIVDIPSAQLSLPNGDTVSQQKPIAGISEITLNNLDAKTIRVIITGTEKPPTVELFDSEEGLIFEVTKQSQTPATITPQSENQTQPEQPTVSETPIELKGLGLGLGLVYAGEREASLPNQIKIPSFLRTDASVFYKKNNWRAALNFKNLLDTKYYESQGSFVVPAAPFTVMGNITFEF
ncbi:AMIN domain-containing protein [Sphaerospermopsis sp. LEGE 08334]|uniref:AMIN domain-containing protein n=1 Tax=Sphaerospermopsis sp. LEGE 08334 TaxID=1828651 RepID=UPI001D1390CD|nr:AMIN domain-containing protein [Sphaerospermopsis sp. LEGE 08334]